MKNRVLFISLLPPSKRAKSGGEQTFSYYFYRFCEDCNYDIRLITCAKYENINEVETTLSSINHSIVCWGDPQESKIKKIVNIESKFNPLNRNANLTSNTTEAKILEYINEYLSTGFVPDVIILEWTEIVVLANRIKKEFPSIPIIASEHDVTFIGYKRKYSYYHNCTKLLWKYKYYFEKRAEIRALGMCDYVLPHNADNIKELLNAGIKNERIEALVPFYHDMSKIVRSSLDNSIVFFGAMNREENISAVEWFIDSVLPLIKDLNYKFIILGNNPGHVLEHYKNSKIVFTGFVDNIDPYFEKARCFVAPLLMGAGIKIKVLEALSSGVPVLTNEIGIEGIPAEVDKDYYYCRNAVEYSEVIHELFENSQKGKLIGENGKRCVTQEFAPELFYEKYKKIINQLITERSSEV